MSHNQKKKLIFCCLMFCFREQQKKIFSEKEFKIRNSPLTDRLENNEDIKTVYNLFLIITIFLFINTIAYDYLSPGDESYFGFRLIMVGFNKFYLVIITWLFFNFLTYLAYFALKFWAKVRISLKPKTAKFWDKLWLTILVSNYFLLLYGVQKFVELFEFAIPSALTVVIEQVRLIMKQHAFIRTVAPRVLSYKPHSDQKLILPNFGKFIYFIFAPTLLYKDEYPRTKNIRWKFVFYHLGEIFGVIFCLSLTTERFLRPHFKDICLRKFNISELVTLVVGNCFPAAMVLLCIFYVILHSTQNAVGEILRFGDRRFYKEWWTCKSFSEYYKTWNVLVHEWLFVYIYRDVYEIICPGNKLASKLSVFIVSTVIHEWILISVLGIFFPLLFVEFFMGSVILSAFNLMEKPFGNLAMMFLLILGLNTLVSLYTAEFFARKNYPQTAVNNFEFYKPRFLSCIDY